MIRLPRSTSTHRPKRTSTEVADEVTGGAGGASSKEGASKSASKTAGTGAPDRDIQAKSKTDVDEFVGAKAQAVPSSGRAGPKRRSRSAGARGATAGLRAQAGTKLKKAVVGAMLGLSFLSPMAAQAQATPGALDAPPATEQLVTGAQTQQQPGPTLSVFDAMLTRNDTTDVGRARSNKVSADDGAGVNIETTFENDNLPPALGGLIDENQRFGDYGDDDGMTAKQRLEVTVTSPTGDNGVQKQVVGWASWRMLTERRLDDTGAFRSDYGFQRNDEISAGVQLNTRAPITDDGTVHLVYGVGGGVQLRGPLGLDHLQDWFHTMPMGGRHLPDSPHGTTGSALQHQYASDVGVSGLLTGGVQLVAQPFTNELLTLKAGAQTQIPLGAGALTVQAGAGFELQPLPSLELSGGIRAHGQYVMGDHLDFFADDDLKTLGLGADVGLRLDLEELAGLKTAIIAQVHFNDLAGSGAFGESTTYSVGLSIPLGAGSWLSPSR